MRYAKTVIARDETDAGRIAAGIVDEAIRAQPDIVLALPTGATPRPMYADLVRRHRQTDTDWSRVTTFNLDEYAGIAPDHPASYARYMAEHLFAHVNLPADRRHLPNGLAADPEAEAVAYEAAIDRAGGIDLAVLGLGINGHLAFNEPARSLMATTHLADLAPETWRRNFPELAAERATWAGDVPFRRAYTMGIATIMQSKRILLLATGSTKRRIVATAQCGTITTDVPASLLSLHRDVTIVLDRLAAGLP